LIAFCQARQRMFLDFHSGTLTKLAGGLKPKTPIPLFAILGGANQPKERSYDHTTTNRF
jgi:hypothetical protein